MSTLLGLNKKAGIFVDDVSNTNSLKENYSVSIQILLKYVVKSRTAKKPAMVQLIASCGTGDRPSPEPMMTQFDMYASPYLKS